MTIVSIVGMHRSGTSMVTRLLNLSGFYLGEEKDILQASSENPEGFWENLQFITINNEILSKLGGGWDFPPQVDSNWQYIPSLAPAYLKAKKLAQTFAPNNLWAWKDPRTSLTLPFWREIFPSMKVLICLRSPFDVAQSLLKRNYFSPASSFNLWLSYNQRILAATDAKDRVITHYDSYFKDPQTELRRVTHLLGLTLSEEVIKNSTSAISSSLRNNESTFQNLIEANVSAELVALYESMCLEAQRTQPFIVEEKPVSPTQIIDVDEMIKKNNIARLEVENFQKEQMIQAFHSQVGERDSIINQQKNQLDEQHIYIKQLGLQIEEKKQSQLQLLGDNFILQQKYKALIQSKSWKITQPLRWIIEIAHKITSKIYRVTTQTIQPRGFVVRQIPAHQTVVLNQFHFAIENQNDDSGTVSAHGWAFHEDWKITQAGLVASDSQGNTNTSIFVHKKERMDVYQQFQFENAVSSGFWGEAKLPIGKYQISFIFTLENETQIIVDVQTPFKISLTKNTKTSRLQALLKSVTTTRVKKFLAHAVRGNFSYLKERIDYVIQENTTSTTINNQLELAYCAQFFSTPNSENHTPSLQQEIDIIIPIYNGMQYVVKLFDQLLKNTNTPFRMIVVDDHSPDPLIVPYLEKLAQQNPNMLLLRNEVNKGFVATINYASGFAKNHFVILNSDVEVPPGWLQRLMKPILSHPHIASTTPFTNAGTICSFPTPLVDNPIFADLDVETIDSVFQDINQSAMSIKLPTGVGFCMGINVDVWKQIGHFDEERFGRGYGEENDWCMRASQAGYENQMTPDLFVYHKHGGSFSSEEKKQLASQNLQKLLGLYPTYQGLVEAFIKADPPQALRKFASLRLMEIASSEKPLLIIDHEIGGGANAYRKQLIQDRLANGQFVLLLTFDTQQKANKLQAFYKEYEEIFYISHIEDLFILPAHIQIGEIFYNNMVSFASPIEMLKAIQRLRKSSGAKLTIAIHDYYSLCTSYTLLDHTGSYCNLPSIEVCQACLPKNPHRNQSDPDDIIKWREGWSELLQVADEIICFSESSAKLVTQVYGFARQHISVRPHKPLIQLTKKLSVNVHAPLRIGIVGGINYAKGSQMVVDVAKKFSQIDPNVKLIVIGTLNEIVQLPNLTITGRYDVSQLPNILEQHQINVCFFPSIWPETYSYVTSELVQLEMPIACFNIGAPAERVKIYEFGWLIENMHANNVVDELIAFHKQLKHNSKIKEGYE